MLLIRPLDISPAMVTSSNAGADDAAYNPATSYTLGQRVYVAADGRTYECVQAPALGQNPATSPLYWMRAEPSNRWAMWDAEISTASQVAGNLTATLTVPARFNAVGIFGLVGDTLTVVQKSAAGVTLWSETRGLKSNPSGWYSYFYEPRTQLQDVVLTSLVPVSGSRIEITVTGSATACAAVVVGSSMFIGDAQYGFAGGIVSTSKKEINATTGVQTLKKGPSSKRMTGTLVQPRSQFNAVFKALKDLDATPCVVVGVPDSADYEPFTILGFYRDFQIEATGPTHHICSLDFESLT